MIRGLFCGVSEYRGANTLPFCKNDVESLKSVLVEKFMVDDEDIEIIAKEGEIDNDEYIQQLSKFSGECDRDDLAILYFSGHASISSEGYNYLCVTNTFNEYTGVYIDALIDIFSKSRAKSKLVILDCCHADNKHETKQQVYNADKMIEDLYQAGISIFYSCEKEQTSNPYYGGQISAFTQFLCDALSYKGIYRDGGLYFYDIKLLVERYAEVWNSKNKETIQTPIFRTNMIGTIIFPLRKCYVKEEQKRYEIHTKNFSIIDLRQEIKTINAEYEKTFAAKIVANVDIRNDVLEFVDEVSTTIRKIKLPANTPKQKMTEHQEVDVVRLSIGNDMLDAEEAYWEYSAVWESNKEFRWGNKLGNKKVRSGNITYAKQENYEQLRHNRLAYVYPDNELREFCNQNIDVLVKKTELVISEFRNYENEDSSFEQVQKMAKNIAVELDEVYDKSFNAYFSLPGSELKEFSDLSYNLAVLLKEMLWLLTLEKSEESLIANYKIKLAEYYEKLNRWNEVRV